MKLVAVVGPTATGKTALGVALADAIGGEIVSCDSTAVYRGIDIGTDKPTAEERRGIPHHLIDVVAPTETYSAARFAADASAAIRDIRSRGRWAILVGGTGCTTALWCAGCSRGRRATTNCVNVSPEWPLDEVSTLCTGGSLASIQTPLCGFNHAIRSA